MRAEDAVHVGQVVEAVPGRHVGQRRRPGGPELDVFVDNASVEGATGPIVKTTTDPGRGGGGGARGRARRRRVPRPGQHADDARRSCFLASSRASYVTGSVYTVDGGMTGF